MNIINIVIVVFFKSNNIFNFLFVCKLWTDTSCHRSMFANTTISAIHRTIDCIISTRAMVYKRVTRVVTCRIQRLLSYDHWRQRFISNIFVVFGAILNCFSDRLETVPQNLTLAKASSSSVTFDNNTLQLPECESQSALASKLKEAILMALMG